MVTRSPHEAASAHVRARPGRGHQAVACSGLTRRFGQAESRRLSRPSGQGARVAATGRRALMAAASAAAVETASAAAVCSAAGPGRQAVTMPTGATETDSGRMPGGRSTMLEATAADDVVWLLEARTAVSMPCCISNPSRKAGVGGCAGALWADVVLTGAATTWGTSSTLARSARNAGGCGSAVDFTGPATVAIGADGLSDCAAPHPAQTATAAKAPRPASATAERDKVGNMQVSWPRRSSRGHRC